MSNTPPPHLAQGISLVQAGRKTEALAYLRQAARTEPLNAEGWLWLAAASDDLEEYRLCVDQALRLDPAHPTARRMQNDLRRYDESSRALPHPGMPPPGYEGYAAYPQAQPRRRTGRRLLAALLLLLLCGAGIAALIVSGVAGDLRDQLLNDEDAEHSLQFTVGEGNLAYTFYVEVPESWLPADTDSATWQAKRDELIAAFPGSADVWDEVQTSFSRTVRNPVYGELRPEPISLVETDPAALERHGLVVALTLLEIQAMPPPPDDQPMNVCERLQLLQPEFEVQDDPGGEILSALVVQRDPRDDCALVIQRRFADPPAGDLPFLLSSTTPPPALREILLAVPIEDENRYAMWRLRLADEEYAAFEDSINQIIGSLDVVFTEN